MFITEKKITKLKFPLPKPEMSTRIDFYTHLQGNIRLKYMEDDLNISSRRGKRIEYFFKEEEPRQIIFDENNLNHRYKNLFQKYTSKLYYKYAYDLLDTLKKKTNYENKKRLLHTSFIYLTYILYNCGNIPYLSNFDLMIFCCFYLGVKVIIKQNKVPGLTKFKKIWSKVIL